MKRVVLLLLVVLLVSLPLMAVPMGTSARSAIPSEIQQIICVDYRALKNSPTALALKARVLPEQLKEFETALKGIGIDPDKDVEQLTFASFRSKGQLQIIGIAQGQFAVKKITQKLKLKKVKSARYRLSDIYPMAGGQDMSFLDDFTLLFGARKAVQSALDARDGEAPSMTANTRISDMVSAVENGPVWSVLDAEGTQNMLHSTLGDAAKLADYDVIRKRLLGSRYTMDFQNGVNFNLDVVTSDSMTAATLASLLKAGVLFRKTTAQGPEKVALDSVTVDNDSANLTLRFKTDEQRFQALMQSELFTTMTR